MTDPIFSEPGRDPQIAAALRMADAPPDPAGDDALARRIVQAARPRLAELRRAPQPWWAWTAAWARFAIPLGTAAGLVAALLAVRETDALLDASAAMVSADAAAALDTIAERAILLGFAEEDGSDVAGRLVAEATDQWIAAEVLER